MRHCTATMAQCPCVGLQCRTRRGFSGVLEKGNRWRDVSVEIERVEFGPSVAPRKEGLRVDAAAALVIGSRSAQRRGDCGTEARATVRGGPLLWRFSPREGGDNSKNKPNSWSLSAVAPASTRSTLTNEEQVLSELSKIIDPDFGEDIVSCGFVKKLQVDESTGEVSFELELTTPACPVKDMFLEQSKEKVGGLPWVKDVIVTMTSQPAKPLITDNVPKGLQRVSNVVAVSSCKGGVGKSTCAVNLAYSLAGMGARVGIFDADVYGPSLPTMVSPEVRVLQMVNGPTSERGSVCETQDAETRTIIPTEYMGVKLVSFGFAGQGSAIMRGPMVSGVINQLLTTTEWGELDYLIIDMPPGTGDIQLTLCQVVPLTAAVIVTTPQKLAFIDVAKGIRMFTKLKVPCIAVVENMCYFDADGKRYYPFGKGSGSQVVQEFGVPHLYELPIRPELSAAGDTGSPEVVVDPQGEVAKVFSDIGVCVVQECAKLRQQVATAVIYDQKVRAIRVKIPGTDEEFYLHPATVRRNDRSAKSIDEWTGEQRLRYSDIAEDIEPESIQAMGNYAVAINWPDGFSQIAPYDQLQSLERLVDLPEDAPEEKETMRISNGERSDGSRNTDESSISEAEQEKSKNVNSILQHAKSLHNLRSNGC